VRNLTTAWLLGLFAGLAPFAVAPREASAQVVAPADPTTHVVQRGESLSLIAAMHRVSVADLADRNHLHEPYALRHNQRLRLPSSAAAAPAPGPARAAAESMTAVRAATLAAAARPVARVAVLRRPVSNATRGSGSGGRRACGRWGCPRRPGIVSLVRLATSQQVTANLAHPGRGGLGVMRSFLRSTDSRTHAIDPRLLRQLALFSDHFGGRALEVISGFRPVRAGQHTAHSNHNVGHAVDFRVRGVPNHVTRDYCRTLANTGCGFYPRSVFIHMDVRSASAYWVDWSRPGERPRYGREGHPPADAPARMPSARGPDDTGAAMPPPGADPELDDVIADAPTVRTATPDPDDERDDPATADHPAEHGPAPTPAEGPQGAPQP
jgi:LysM repeat protein